MTLETGVGGCRIWICGSGIGGFQKKERGRAVGRCRFTTANAAMLFVTMSTVSLNVIRRHTAAQHSGRAAAMRRFGIGYGGLRGGSKQEHKDRKDKTRTRVFHP